MVLGGATIVNSGQHLSAGARLGERYLVTSLLRDDGGSTLYGGRIAATGGDPVMIKEVMPDGFASDENRANAQVRFLREVQILKELRHPSLPTVLDAFVEHGRHYMVMSYCPGETLELMLARRGAPFAEVDVVGWALEILSALGEMHRHNPPVIYRNLKPGSIVIDPSGTVRLVDFGLARFYTQGKRNDTVPIGAVGYAPPEQTAGATDPRSDLFALGATMYHLLTNQHPSDALPAASALSGGLVSIIARAMDRDPGRRWPSAAEMEMALRRHMMVGTTTLRSRPGPLLPKLSDAQTASCARLVITSIRPSTVRDEIMHHLTRLTWMPGESLEAVLDRLPAVVPLVEPYKSSLRVLKGLGLDATPVWPLRGMYALDAEAAARLQEQGSVEIPDPAAGDGGLCLCRHCHFGWMLDDPTQPVPNTCPSCGREGWATVNLRRCTWCGHEFEERAQSSACPCCGLWSS